jgi:hypothetical protein
MSKGGGFSRYQEKTLLGVEFDPDTITDFYDYFSEKSKNEPPLRFQLSADDGTIHNVNRGNFVTVKRQLERRGLLVEGLELVFANTMIKEGSRVLGFEVHWHAGGIRLKATVGVSDAPDFMIDWAKSIYADLVRLFERFGTSREREVKERRRVKKLQSGEAAPKPKERMSAKVLFWWIFGIIASLGSIAAILTLILDYLP